MKMLKRKLTSQQIDQSTNRRANPKIKPGFYKGFFRTEPGLDLIDDNVVSGEVLVKEFDIHYQIDSFGSRQEFVK